MEDMALHHQSKVCLMQIYPEYILSIAGFCALGFATLE